MHWMRTVLVFGGLAAVAVWARSWPLGVTGMVVAAEGDGNQQMAALELRVRQLEGRVGRLEGLAFVPRPGIPQPKTEIPQMLPPEQPWFEGTPRGFERQRYWVVPVDVDPLRRDAANP